MKASGGSYNPVMQDPSNAINHNRYAYCLNNPLKYTDPTGKDYYTESFSQGGTFFYRGSYVNAGPLTTGSDRVGGGGSCGKPGEWVDGVGFNGTGRDGVYFDWKTGTQRDMAGNVVADFDFNTVISRYAYAIKAECVYEGQATNRGDGSYVSDENGLVSVFLIITECNPVIPAGQGGYSGDNIFLKTWSHYQVGGRKDLNVSTSSLDFGFVSKKNLVYNSKDNTYSVNLFSLNKFSQTSLALGKVSLNSIGNNRYTINRDYYDFNIEWSQGFGTRNIGTFGAGLIHGPVIDNIPVPLPIFPFFGPSVYTGSGPYWINFSGSVYIKP